MAASWEEVKVAQIGELGGATCRPRIPRAAVLLDLDTLLLRSRDRAGPSTARSRNISDSLVLSMYSIDYSPVPTNSSLPRINCILIISRIYIIPILDYKIDSHLFVILPSCKQDL